MLTVSCLDPVIEGDGRALKKTLLLLENAKKSANFEAISAILDHCEAAKRIAEKRAAA